jgi:hypothetical protein
VEGYKASTEELLQVLDKNTELICSLLKKRLEAVFSSTLDSVSSYKIVNMIQFYTQTLSKVTSAESTLSKTMLSLLEAASEVFLENLKVQSKDILRNLPVMIQLIRFLLQISSRLWLYVNSLFNYEKF